MGILADWRDEKGVLLSPRSAMARIGEWDERKRP